jgi:uncharacterized protein
MITTLVLKCIRACNLRCPYCYYINEETENYGATISIECAKNLYSKFSSSLRKDQLGATLIWHGGEPLMLGRKRFQALLDAQAHYFKPGTVKNCVQTNGVLINDAWAEFFERNEIRVGISLDGPADIHDRYRPKSKGRGTHSEVLRAMELLTSRGISFGVIAVANPAVDGTEVIRHFRDLGIGGCDLLLPMTNHALQRRTESAVDIPGLRRYLVDSFREWIKGDKPGPKIRLFEAMILNALGVHRPFANAGGSEETVHRCRVWRNRPSRARRRISTWPERKRRHVQL